MLKTSTESSTSSEEEKEENEAESEDQETDHNGDRESVRDEGDDEDSNDEMNHEGEGENISIRRTEWMRRRQEEQEVQISRAIEATEQANALLDWMDCEDVESEDGDEDVIDTTSSGRFTHFIRHGGCINTATWLTSPWRLSLAGRGCSDEASTVHSEECPTQLITSGDDRQVKFWDVRHAIGTSNPLPGGKNTVCPFSSDVPDGPPTDKWKDSFAKSVNPVSGSIIPLASLDTRHRGNVFHVTPVDSDPGKVVTCGADGFLRCADLSTGSSSVVISPEFDRERHDLFLSPGGLLSLRPGMCFSHHFVDENTGLLCSERGLRRFDLRVNPREQHAGSVLSSETCKACAIWSRDSTDSAYVFGKSR
jgi:WD40 repeat protein